MSSQQPCQEVAEASEELQEVAMVNAAEVDEVRELVEGEHVMFVVMIIRPLISEPTDKMLTQMLHPCHAQELDILASLINLENIQEVEIGNNLEMEKENNLEMENILEVGNIQENILENIQEMLDKNMQIGNNNNLEKKKEMLDKNFLEMEIGNRSSKIPQYLVMTMFSCH